MSNFSINDIINSPAGKNNAHLTAKPKKGKYNNVKVIDSDGDIVDSKKERKRGNELRLLLRQGDIIWLAKQVKFSLSLGQNKTCIYIADYVYQDKAGLKVEDVKSDGTRKLSTYRLKKAMMKAQHGIEIKEV
jgi:hypothetical protein